MAVNFTVKPGAKKAEPKAPPAPPVTMGAGPLSVGGKQVGEVSDMAVAVQEHKPKFKSVTEEQLKVDEMVIIDQKMKALEVPEMQKRYDELKKELAATAKTLDPTKPATFVGTEGQIEFSPAREESKVKDKEALIAALGQEVFNQIATVSITDLKKYLSEHELIQLVEKVYGSRTLKSVVAYAPQNS